MHASIFQFGLERVFLYCDNKRGQKEKEEDGWICGLSSNNRDGGGDATLRHDVNNVKITQSENPREKRTAARNREDDEKEEEEEREMER